MTTPENQAAHKEHEDLPAYYQTARFPGELSSAASYTHIQHTIYGEPCNLATYRLLFMPDNLWHVVVLGDEPAADLRRRLTESLSNDELVSVAVISWSPSTNTVKSSLQ